MIDSIKDFFDGIQEYHESLIKDSNDPKVIKNNFDKFTTDELKEKMNRLSIEENIREINNKRQNSTFIGKISSNIANSITTSISNKISDLIIGDNEK